jgi:divalent metal cation (Fe/Co/Zn/Cd) transporter
MLLLVAGQIFYYGVRKTLLFVEVGTLEQPAIIALYAALASVIAKEFRVFLIFSGSSPILKTN